MESRSVEKEVKRAALMGRCRGQAIIEFTLMLPIILIIVGGLTDLGLALYASISTQNAVREGARLAAAGAGSTVVQSEVTSRIASIGQFTDISVAPPSKTSMAACAGQQSVTVTATGTYHFAFLKYIGFSTMSVSRSATMRDETTPLCTA
jgi:Flp pilus assembly protein TadG